MATISNKRLAQMRREFTKGKHPNYPKSTLNAAFQGLEDYYVSTQAEAKTALDEATSPHTFDGADSKQLAAITFKFKYDEDK